MTAVFYLNDGAEFSGGATSFFCAGGERGGLRARGVKPRAGAMLLFPHGDAHPGLVHEGSPVLEGVKYIVRTDILYYNRTPNNT